MTDRQKSSWWWVYFIIIALMTLASVLFGSDSPLDALNAVMSGVGLIGLFGYVRDIAIGWRLFWVAYFAINLLFFAIFLGSNAWLAWQHSTALPAFIALAAGAISLPLILANYRYAFRSSYVWHATAAA